MKYKIKWPWAGAEQTAIVSNNDGAKPVAALYFYDNNGRVNKDDYVLLHEGEVITGNCRAIGLTSCAAIGNDWSIEVVDTGWYKLKYCDVVMLEWKATYGDVMFYDRKRLAEWCVKEQPVLEYWQTEKIIGSYQALNYLKASIEHE